MGNVKIAASEAKNISNARAASSDGVEVVTQPCTKSDFTGNDLSRFKEWNSVNQNPEVFTDEYISKMFKFEPVADITDKQTGFKVTYTKPADAPYTYMYWGNIVLFDKNGNMIVSQDVDEIFSHSDGYEWFFPYVDPKRNPKEPELIGLQFKPDGKRVNKMYKIKSNDGLGKPKDLPPYKEHVHHNLSPDASVQTQSMQADMVRMGFTQLPANILGRLPGNMIERPVTTFLAYGISILAKRVFKV